MPLHLLIVASETASEQEARRKALGEASHESYAAALAVLAPDARIDAVSAVEAAAVPASERLGAYDGIFFAGSPIQMHEESETTRAAARFMAAVFAAGTPSFGSCAGLQIAAVAAGGVSAPRDGPRETAFARGIAATPAGLSHPLLAGRPVTWDAPAMHSSIVARLPEGGTVLATARHTPVEAAEIRFSNGVFWGVQYHPELTIREIAGSIRRQSGELIEEGLARDEESLDGYAALLEALDDEPERRDIAWRIGVDEEVVDPDRRTLELGNFLGHVRAGRRG